MNEFFTNIYEAMIATVAIIVGIGMGLCLAVVIGALVLLVTGFFLGSIGEGAKRYRKWKRKQALNKFDTQIKKAFSGQDIKIVRLDQEGATILQERMNRMGDEDPQFKSSFDQITADGLAAMNKNNKGNKPN